VDLRSIQEAAKRLKLINHPLNRKILELVRKKPGTTFAELCSELTAEASVICLHLELLIDHGIFEKETNRPTASYRINLARFNRIMQGIRVINGSFSFDEDPMDGQV